MASNGDAALRAMTDDGGFRVITVRTTDMVRAAIEAQSARGEVARWFGELLTGAVLFRETMAPSLRVQCILQGAGGKGQLVADSMPGGGTRGLVRLPKNTKLTLTGGALLQMMRTLPNGELHKGVVQVPNSGSISDGLMAYMQTSEQVVSMISVGCRMAGHEVAAAGGYLVQLLPELEENVLAVMTERLGDFESIDGLLDGVAASPDTLMAELLYGMSFTRLNETPVRFDCHCNQVRVMASLASLPRDEIADLTRDGEVLELSCDYCGKVYRVGPASLKGLLDVT